jgi:hypothetical protein
MAGPVLIVLGPLIVLHGFWLAGDLSNQHVDLLSFWLPRWCFLGSSLADGHIPTWLPHQFAGVPFASDPQSGWLSLPVMGLFSTLSCARALGVTIALNPILAGLGLYWFFRHEGLGRPASTVGALTLALPMAGSVVALSMPFAGTLAWTALALAGASGYLHARTTARLIGWLALTGLALSQVAAAHLTHGLLTAVLVVGLYVAARSILQVREKRRSALGAIGLGVGLLAAFPVLAAAVFVPRLALLPRTSLGHGYLELARLTAELSGPLPRPVLAEAGVSPWWGTSFARGPGGYVGALAVLLVLVALASPRWRLPAAAFAAAGLTGWLLNLDAVIRSEPVRDLALRSGIGELWLRDPARLRYLPLLAFGALAGYGLQAWLDGARVSGGRAIAERSLWLVPPIVLFVLLPLAAGSPAGPYALFLAAAIPTVALLAAAARGRSLAVVALPALVAVELTTAGLIPVVTGPPPPPGPAGGEPAEAFGHAFGQLHAPNVDPGAYLTPGPIGRALLAIPGEGRYLSYDPEVARQWRGFLTHQGPDSWGAYENGRSILFGIDEVQGYSPLQLDRYWRLVRAANPEPIFYNASTLQEPEDQLLQLLGVELLISRQPGQPRGLFAREGEFALTYVGRPVSRVSFVARWRRAPPGEALRQVLEPDFEGNREVIVEDAPRLDGRVISSGQVGLWSASYEELSANHVRVRVQATVPGIVVVRNSFDRNWRATRDGMPAPVFVVDYLMQGVVIPAGTHTVDLTYEDDAVGVGLAVSAGAWAVLGATLLWALARERRRRNSPAPARAASVMPEPTSPSPIHGSS